MGKELDRLSYSVSASDDAQTNLWRVVTTWESLTGEHRAAVGRLLSDFEAGEVSEGYQGVELDWEKHSEDIQDIIRVLREVLEENNVTAQGTMQRAARVVDGLA